MARNDYDPFEKALRVHTKVSRMLSELLDTHRPLRMMNEAQWQPPTDVYETPEAIVVCMVIAGMESSEEINLDYRPNMLTVSGHRTAPAWLRNSKCHQMEIENGRFMRRVEIPIQIDEERIKAVYRQGILEVVLPKRSQNQRRHISISGE